MASMNLKPGECVHYGAHGVCRVCGRETRQMGGKQRSYFTLRPTGHENILLYLPEDAEPEKVRLRRLLSRQEILELIRQAGKVQTQWIPDSKARREAFSKILHNGDAQELIGMLKAISQHEEALPQGKQLPMSDQEMQQAAKRQLYSEMAYVLSIEESQVQPFIMGQLAEEAKGQLSRDFDQTGVVG